MQSLSTKESLTNTSKESTNNRKQLEENIAKATKGKGGLDVKFLKKKERKMFQLIIRVKQRK